MKNIIAASCLILSLGPIYGASPVGTAFTYQGRLASGANVANGYFDFSFALYDAASAGTQIGSTVTTNALSVANGLFNATLDFGSAFDGNARWLDISVKTNGAGVYTQLVPRQLLQPAPYALYAPNAGSALLASSVVPGSITSASLAPGAVTQLGTPGGSMTNAVQVAPNGFVGIGTTTNNPVAALEIAGGAPVLSPLVYDEVKDGEVYFTNLAGACSMAFSTNLLAIAAPDDNAVVLADTTGSVFGFQTSIQQGQGAFTNMGGVSSVAFSPTSRLLAIAAKTSNAVTLVDVSTPWSPVWKSVMRDGSGTFTLLAGANAVAFSPNNLLAIAASTDNSVSLVTVSTPTAPVLAGYVQQGYNNFTNIHNPSAVAFSGNILAIAGISSNAVTLVDVSTPSTPVLRSVIRDGQGAFNFLRTPTALAISGNLMAVSAYADHAVTLVNITDPANPTLYSAIVNNSNGVSLLVNPRGLSLFQRNGRTLLAVCADSSYALSIFDVTDPVKPVRLAAFVYGTSGLHYLYRPQSVAVNANGRLGVTSLYSSGAITLLGLTDQKAAFVSDNWVGIGTTNPVRAALDVNGDVLVENAERFQAQANRFELGKDATAQGSYASAVGKGASASGDYSTALGNNTVASGSYSTAMGQGSTASGYYSTALGLSTVASGYASTAMGYASVASNSYSMAAGNRAKALHQGSFVWADSQSADFSSTNNDQFLVRAKGGMQIHGTVAATNVIYADSMAANDGHLEPGLTFGGSGSSEGIASKRTSGGNQYGIDFYTMGANRMSISNNGDVSMKGRLGVNGNLQVDGSIVTTNIQVNGNLAATNSITVDSSSLNRGMHVPGLLFGGTGSGESIASKRDSGGNQFGIDFYSGYVSRMSLSNNGDLRVSGKIFSQNMPAAPFVRYWQEGAAWGTTWWDGEDDTYKTVGTLSVPRPAAGTFVVTYVAEMGIDPADWTLLLVDRTVVNSPVELSRHKTGGGQRLISFTCAVPVSGPSTNQVFEVWANPGGIGVGEACGVYYPNFTIMYFPP